MMLEPSAGGLMLIVPPPQPLRARTVTKSDMRPTPLATRSLPYNTRGRQVVMVSEVFIIILLISWWVIFTVEQIEISRE
jgi:hypothetical protein